MAIQELLKFCGHQRSTFKLLSWRISETVIIARKDSYCWRFLYRYKFHRAHRSKRSCHYKKHVLKLKNLNFFATTCEWNANECRKYQRLHFETELSDRGRSVFSVR